MLVLVGVWFLSKLTKLTDTTVETKDYPKVYKRRDWNASRSKVLKEVLLPGFESLNTFFRVPELFVFIFYFIFLL